jgi:hypothetical protein
MARSQFIDWQPNDLDGLGQSTWRDETTRIMFCVDGNGMVRTVLPHPPGRCAYIVDNYTNDPDERICGNQLPCKRHP